VPYENLCIKSLPLSEKKLAVARRQKNLPSSADKKDKSDIWGRGRASPWGATKSLPSSAQERNSPHPLSLPLPLLAQSSPSSVAFLSAKSSHPPPSPEGVLLAEFCHTVRPSRSPSQRWLGHFLSQRSQVPKNTILFAAS
jgi:hypothetical protein